MPSHLLYVVNDATYMAAYGSDNEFVKERDETVVVVVPYERVYTDRGVRTSRAANWTSLRDGALEQIRRFTPAQATIVAHLPAFKPLVPESMSPQRRIHEAEEELRAALGQNAPDILVCGFRNVGTSNVSQALATIASEEAPALLDRVNQAIHAQTRADSFSQLSVLKHRLIGMFLSLDLDIQMRQLDPQRMPEIDFAQRVREKVRSSQDVLGSMRHVGVPQDALNGACTLLQEDVVMRNTSNARLFRAWMDNLNTALDGVRQRAGA